MNAAYKTICDELKKTSVISNDFKGWLRDWIQAAIQEAYEKGQEDAKRLPN